MVSDWRLSVCPACRSEDFFVENAKLIFSLIDNGQNLFLTEGCSYIIAAEQKARLTYDNILRLVDDPDVRDVIKFIRARVIVHFQRFGEALRLEQEGLDARNFYAFNPQFDKRS